MTLLMGGILPHQLCLCPAGGKSMVIAEDFDPGPITRRLMSAFIEETGFDFRKHMKLLQNLEVYVDVWFQWLTFLFQRVTFRELSKPNY
jgi:hypothetical protein